MKIVCHFCFAFKWKGCNCNQLTFRYFPHWLIHWRNMHCTWTKWSRGGSMDNESEKSVWFYLGRWPHESSHNSCPTVIPNWLIHLSALTGKCRSDLVHSRWLQRVCVALAFFHQGLERLLWQCNTYLILNSYNLVHSPPGGRPFGRQREGTILTSHVHSIRARPSRFAMLWPNGRPTKGSRWGPRSRASCRTIRGVGGGALTKI